MSGDASSPLPTGLGCEEAEKVKQKLEDYGVGTSESCSSHTFDGTKRGCKFYILSFSLSVYLFFFLLFSF